MSLRPVQRLSVILQRNQLVTTAASALGVPSSSRTIKTVSSQVIDTCSKPAPFPYESKKYRWYHSFFNYDTTTDRLDENSKLILVEGNIGVGKSTLAKKLAEELGMKYFPEAACQDLYSYLYGYDLRDYDNVLPETCRHFEIQDFYENPHHPVVGRFQIMKYYARNLQYIKALLHILSTGQGVIMERSAFSDFVFVDAMTKMGLFSPKARRFYYELKSNTIQELMRPHVIIYLDAPVDTCMERIKQRNIVSQACEKEPYEVSSEVMTKDYLKNIERGYKEYYLKQMEPFVEMIVYDWSKPAEAEVVADDLEKIDFDRDRVYFDPKFRDWRNLVLPSDWDTERVRYTRWETWLGDNFNLPEEYGAKELWIGPDEMYRMDVVLRDEIQLQNKYQHKRGDFVAAVKNFFAF